MFNLLATLFETAKIDIFALNPNACRQSLENNYKIVLRRRSGRSRKLTRFFTFCSKTVGNTLYFKRHPVPRTVDQITLLCQTKNQETSLKPIAKEIEQLENSPKTVMLDSTDFLFLKRFGITCWISFLFLPVCIAQWLKSADYERNSFRHALDSHLYTYGLYFRLRRWIRHNRPTVIIVSNDHIQFPCVLVAAARAENTPTIYVQHACVTDRFPPLATDFALLDGLDAKEKYLSAGETTSDITLIGPTRMDGYHRHINTNNHVTSIGVCFSVADDYSRIFQLLNALTQFTQLTIIVRPHYAMNADIKKQIQKFADDNHFKFSAHSKVTALDFLKTVDLLISGVSSIALEAAMLDLSVINFVLNIDEVDWYDFVHHGLVKSTSDLNELEQFIKSNISRRQGNRRFVERYVGTFDTEYDGRSATLAAEKIVRIFERNKSRY